MILPAPYYARQTSLRSRVVAALLSAGLLVLLLLALLSLGWTKVFKQQDGGHLVSVSFQEAQKGPKAKAMKADHAEHSTQAQQRQTTPVENPPPQPVPTTRPSTSFIHLSREDFAASDISRFSHANSGDAGTSSKAQGPGEGPGGARLYRAMWYREPTDAELRPYIEHSAPPGSWAIIACQTVEHYHVENCRELDEYPLGSGLARGLRRAAWQFLVWPPRIDGKPQVGTWVSIRFDFSREARD